MKKVLVTGENGYLGKQLKGYLENKEYIVDCMSIRSSKINQIEFKKYDVIIHAAAIVHQKSSNQFFSINRDLTYKIAKLAKENGVNHLIFFSTMSVFGKSLGEISFNTPLRPNNDYGKSKLEAEVLIKNLEDDNFKISIVRPPMIYGFNCPGNYKTLSKIANLWPTFPRYKNQRSMIFIENLCELTYLIIKHNLYGIFHPQDKEYVSTSKLFKKIREVNGKGTSLISVNTIFRLNVLKRISIFKKVFGDLFYSKELSKIEFEYQIINFEESIIKSERGKK